MNLHYIRAAIRENTGVELSLKDTRDILLEEGLITKQEAKRAIFTGYGEIYRKGEEISLQEDYEDFNEYVYDKIESEPVEFELEIESDIKGYDYEPER